MWYKEATKILFLLPAEFAHRLVFRLLGLGKALGLIKPRIPKNCLAPIEIAGLVFPNRVGLAAGLDKNAEFAEYWSHFGFGFAEIGTVTPLPQRGNPKPRLFRLKKERAIINRMGFNNAGLETVSRKLQKRKRNGCLIGGNIGKNKQTPNQEAQNDYLKGLESLHPYVDYFTINVSSPNTPELRDLQAPQALRRLLLPLMELNQALEPRRPLFVKLDPDMSFEQLDEVLQVLMELKIDGVIATNTSSHRSSNMSQRAISTQGGISGAPIFKRALERVQFIQHKTKGELPIIACGGIDSLKKAQLMRQAGASLVQVYTGFIYQGPDLIQKLAKGLDTFVPQ